MIRETLNAVLACVVTFVLCAVAYPAAVYGVGHVLFPRQAGGSLIERDGVTIGSELIAQPFTSDGYFAPRPSAAGATGYAADAASGSNLGTTNPALRDRIALDSARRIASKTLDADLATKLAAFDQIQGDPKLADRLPAAQAEVLERAARLGETVEADLVPTDLVTTSGSGLDPDISPEGARYQAARVATARGVATDRVLTIIDEHVNRGGAIIGAPPRVNVLRLNLDLDAALAADRGKPGR